jgi:DNA polymerase zeta
MDAARRDPRLFKFRLNCIDHYQAPASVLDPALRPLVSSDESARDGSNVPIIRIFGATETGQKVCAHIHGAFPYLYLEYNGGLGEKEGKA